MKQSRKTVHEMRIDNRAQRTDAPPQSGNGECCYNHLLFAMKDKHHHEFTVGITTILECLHAAQEQGAVPALPDDWWIQIMNDYHIDIPRFQPASIRLRTS